MLYNYECIFLLPFFFCCTYSPGPWHSSFSFGSASSVLPLNVQLLRVFLDTVFEQLKQMAIESDTRIGM